MALPRNASIGDIGTEFGRQFVSDGNGTWSPISSTDTDPSVLKVQDVGGGTGVLVMNVGTEPTQNPPENTLYLSPMATGLMVRDSTGATGSMPPINLPNVVLSQTATIAITSGKRILTVSCPGAIVGDSIMLFPTAPLPSGYAIANAWVSASDTIQVVIDAPALAIGANYSFTCKTIALR